MQEDCALTFNLEGFFRSLKGDSNSENELIDLTRFRHFIVAIYNVHNNAPSYATASDFETSKGYLVAVVTDRYLIVTNDYSSNDLGYARNRSPKRFQPCGVGDVRILLDLLKERGLDSDGDRECDRPSALAWINEKVLVVGFDSGLILGCNCAVEYTKAEETSPVNQVSKPVFEFRGQVAAVRSVHLHDERLWILYENSYLIAVPISEALLSRWSALLSFKMTGHTALYDLTFLSSIRSYNKTKKFFNAQSELEVDSAESDTGGAHSFLVAGDTNAMSVYRLSHKLHFQDADKLKQYVKSKMGSLLGRSLSSFFGYSSPSSSSLPSHGEIESPEVLINRVEQRAVTLTSVMDFQDTKRRIMRLSLDPCGSGLVAAADSLGRVTLFDSHSSFSCVIRLWKGVRDARFSWANIHVEDKSSATAADHGRLCLAIYAPLLGLVSFYRMKHGPCLRIIPVGLHCHLITMVENKEDSGSSHLATAKTYILRSLPDKLCLEMLELNPVQAAESDLDVNDEKGVFAEQLREGLDVSITEQARLVINEESDSDGLDGSGSENSSPTTIQEAENKKILKKIEKVLKSHVTSTSASLFQDRNFIEEKILSALIVKDRQYPGVKGIANDFELAKKVMALIESAELTGTPADANNAMPVVFSVAFHRQITNFLKQLVTCLRKILIRAPLEPEDGADDTVLLNTLTTDVQCRELLLSGYENLLDFQFPAGFDSTARPTLSGTEDSNRYSRSSNSSSIFPMSSTQKPLPSKISNDISAAISTISRQNTVRAEALSWAVRAVKKAERMVSIESASQIAPLGADKTSSNRTNSLAGQVHSSPKIAWPSGGTTLSESENVATRKQSGATTPIFNMASGASKSPVGKEELHSNHYVAMHSCFSFTNSVSFSLFCSFFTTSQRRNMSGPDSSPSGGCIMTANFEYWKLLDFVSATDTLHGIRVSDRQIRKVSVASNSHDARSSQMGCKWVAYDLLKTIIYPLTGMGGIYAASKYVSTTSRCMGMVDPGRRLRQLTPLFFSFLQHQSVSFLVNDVLTKQLTLSPFQKWMRESLLAFHDAVLSLVNYVKKKRRLENNGSNKEDSEAIAQLESPIPADKDVNGSVRSSAASPLSYQRSLVLDLLDEDVNSKSIHEEIMDKGTSFIESEQVEQLVALTVEVLERVSRSKEWGEVESSIDSILMAISTLPSYDEYVSFVLQPSLQLVRISTNLEAAIAFAALVVETLTDVNEQVERRTYGASNLKASILQWEHVVSQLRVCLLLSSRVAVEVEHPFTIQNIDQGLVSIHKLLALDTLCFAMKAEAAVEHEERCQEVFLHRAGELAAVDSSQDHNKSAKEKDSVLLAWGPVANKRWRDIFSLAMAEDSLSSASPQDIEVSVSKANAKPTISPSAGKSTAVASPPPMQQQPARKRRPLLLYFPQHSQLQYLGAYRSILLSERWFKKITQMDLLVSASEHAFMIPPVCRAAVSAEIFKQFVAPVVAALARLEENYISTVYKEDEGQQPAVSQKLLLNVIADKDGGLVKQLVKAAIEFLTFIETAVMNIQESNIISTPEISGPARPNHTEPNAAKGVQSMESAESLLRIQTLIEKRRLATLAGEKSPATTRSTTKPTTASFTAGSSTASPSTPPATPVWPPVADPSLSSIYENFHVGVTQIWGRAVVQKWKVLLLIMQLRFQCGLRGVQPSTLLGPDSMLDSAGDASQTNERAYVTISSAATFETLLFHRVEFLNQSLRLLPWIESTVPVYLLAALWQLEVGLVRVLHVCALLDRGGAGDEEASTLIAQVPKRQRDLLFDAAISCLQTRLGLAIVRVTGLAAFGGLIAAMDSEAAAWARECIPRNTSPDSVVLEDVTRGKVSKPLSPSFESTRELVLSLQSLLLSIPLKERLGLSNVHTDRDQEAVRILLLHSSRRTMPDGVATWVERKERCDALLSLSNTFLQWNNLPSKA